MNPQEHNYRLIYSSGLLDGLHNGNNLFADLFKNKNLTKPLFENQKILLANDGENLYF